MSILSSLYHGEIRDRPNDVHNVPPRPGRGEADHCRDEACEAAENRAGRAHTPAPDGAKDAAESAADRPSAGADSAHLTRGDSGSAPSAHGFAHGTPSPGTPAPGAAVPGAPAPDAATSARPSAGADSVHPWDGHTDGNAVLPAHARRRMRALRDSRLRPPLYYTQQEQNPCASGVWESPHTVASKLESKEEYPQG